MLVESQTLLDNSPKYSYKNDDYYARVVRGPYIIVYTINPREQVPMWIAHLERWFQRHGVAICYQNPQQSVDEQLVLESLGVLLWNGTLPVFDSLKAHFDASNVKYSFVECGFFPQTEHIYFDKYGINVKSSLNTAPLTWLPENAIEIVEQQRKVFFKGVPTYTELRDYIFVPLQLGDDSNIQLHSRFVNGMQEFVDYIESIYPTETIVFKAHPRDKNRYSSKNRNSHWSTDCSKSLIKGAKKVHGINSTVLFEAELYGVETEIEGGCLLTRQDSNKKAMLAALILWQFNIFNEEFSLSKIAERSYLELDEIIERYHAEAH